MLNDAFKNIGRLQQGLDASWTRNSVITNNIANVDTPGFKSSRVEFESAFKRALEGEQSGFAAKVTRPEHYNFAPGEAARASIVKNTNTSYRADGNNVDYDYESIELAKNTFWYYSMIEQISSEFAKLRTVISG